jgi:hypothetical protein
MTQAHRAVHLELSGLIAVHAARAAHTALGAVPGVVSANVSMAGAEIDVVGDVDESTLAADVRRALEPIGLGLIGMIVRPERRLPLG